MNAIICHPRRLLVAIALAYLVLAAGTAASRRPYGDEGEQASPAYTLVHRGYLTVTQWEDHRESRKAYWMPPLYFFAQAAWQSLIGFGVIQFRLGTAVWGLVLLLALYFILRKLTNETGFAILATGLLGLDYTFVMHAGVGRCEMMSAALAILATAAWLHLYERSMTGAVTASHALMAASALTHPVGAMLGMPCLVGVQLWTGWRRMRWTLLLWAALPYIIGGAAWGLYILGNPAEFQSQFLDMQQALDRFGGLKQPLVAFQREAERFLGYYGVRENPASPTVPLKLILPFGYLIGLGGALAIGRLRRQILLRGALPLFLIQVLILTLLEGSKQFHYILHVIPTLVTILAGTLWYSWRTMAVPGRLVAGLVCAIVMVQVAPVLYRIRENNYRVQFLPVVEAARAHIERGDFVVGEPQFAFPFGFPDNFVSDTEYGYGNRRRPDLIIANQVYFQEVKRGLKVKDSPAYQYMDREFPAEFEPFFERGVFTVYRRRGGPALPEVSKSGFPF